MYVTKKANPRSTMGERLGRRRQRCSHSDLDERREKDMEEEDEDRGRKDENYAFSGPYLRGVAFTSCLCLFSQLLGASCLL